MKTCLYGWLCFIFFCHVSFAQVMRDHDGIRYGTITGKVVHNVSGEPIIGANVLLSGTILGAATDNKGQFLISHVEPSTYTLSVTAIGYEKQERTVVVLPGKQIDIDFSAIGKIGVYLSFLNLLTKEAKHIHDTITSDIKE